MGGFTSNVDMRSGSPAFGTPEFTRAAQLSGQLARRYGVPFRSSNVNASNCVDVQSAYESQMALWGAVMGGTNYLMHGAGWLEGGLCASFEKFMVDVELLQQMAEYLTPVQVDEACLAIDAMKDVGPGGHFFGTAHTQERYKTAFYDPLLSDWRNFETWSEAGSVNATDRHTVSICGRWASINSRRWTRGLQRNWMPSWTAARRKAGHPLTIEFGISSRGAREEIQRRAE